MKKIWLSVIFAVIVSIISSITVLAISNPGDIAFGTGNVTKTYGVFTNVYETGDMLFIAEGYVYYAVEPTDYTADKAFIFEVLNTAGNTTKLSIPLVSYGDRPIGIYQTAAQVVSNGFASGQANVIKIRGNPLVFASPNGNNVTATLGAGDYFDNRNVVGGFTPLRNFVINTIAANMQAKDGVLTYKTIALGVQYLSTTGANLFLAGIPGLDTLDPSIFYASNRALTGVTTSGNGTYAQSLTPASVWGTTTSNGLNALGSFLGMGGTNGGLILLWFLGLTVSIGIGTKVQSPLVIIMLLAFTPLAGSLLGLMNLAAALTIALIIIILGVLLFSRSVIA